MSDFSLYQILTIVKDEIKKAQVGKIQRITGPAGAKGEKGVDGGQGPVGPRGGKGDTGPAGPAGQRGGKGDPGKKGSDGEDGIGIARIEQDVDSAIILHLTDGSSYTVEMPLGEGGTMN